MQVLMNKYVSKKADRYTFVKRLAYKYENYTQNKHQVNAVLFLPYD